MKTVYATAAGWDCAWCGRPVPYTPMRQIQINRLMVRGRKKVNVFCHKDCSTAFYNKLASEKRAVRSVVKEMVKKNKEAAKRMDGV